MIDAEATIDTTIETLKDTLPDAIEMLNDLHDDFRIPVPDPGYYSLGTREVLQYPWVEVTVVGTDVTNLDIEQMEGDQASTVIVAVRYQHPDGDILDRSLRRYARAVVNVLMAPDAFGDHDTISAFRIAYGTNPELDETQMLNGVTVCAFTVEGAAYREL